MYKNKKILAIIPARAKSRRLPNKNIKYFCGYPLIYWSIRVAKRTKYIDEVYVSTDGKNIQRIAKQFDAKVPFLRPKKISNHKSKSEDLIINLVKNINKKYHYIILLQPTSPLRKKNEIEFAIKTIINKKYKSFVSRTKYKFTENELFKEKSINKKIFKYLKKRKSLINGSIYILNLKYFLKKKKIIDRNTKYFETNLKSSIDIDNNNDFQLAKIFRKNEVKL